MASARPNPGGQTDGGAEPMDWQTDTGLIYNTSTVKGVLGTKLE